MAFSEIWLTPNGAPSLILEGNKPTTTSKRDRYEKSFPSTELVKTVITTRDYMNRDTVWAFSADGWDDKAGHDGQQDAFSNRSIVGVSLKRESFQTVSLGPTGTMSNDNASGNWSRDVVGVSFVYDRQDCFWDDADMKLNRVAIRYWNISTKEETVELTTLKESGGNHPPNDSSKDGTKAAPPALAVYEVPKHVKDHYRNKNVICIGIYLHFHVYSPGGYGAASHNHYMGICHLSPIHDNDAVNCRPVSTIGPWAPNSTSVRVA